jgi:predicted 2-oxoglutarate/Fe(II)-dependent dioxygenase YbiX
MHNDMGNDSLQPPFNIQHLGYVLQPGQLVLFPSWLLHHVTPFAGEGERITVAFNCALQP